MNVIKRDIIDWEPLRVHLIFREWQTPPDNLQSIIGSWLRQRDANNICNCSTKYEDHGFNRGPHSFTFGCEWMCETCIAAFAGFAERTWPGVDHIELGDYDTGLPEVDKSYVAVPAKRVQFEDLSIISVAPFRIRKRAITVEEFEAFAGATGYKTLAERRRPGRSFRENELLWSKGSREAHTAYLMGYRDALEYCAWANARLPTEAEWLAASVLDEGIYEHDEYLDRHRQLCRRSDALELESAELTSTITADGQVVLRSGPRLVRDTTWRRPPRRSLASPDSEPDLLSCFRICR